jgi:hypothetical protein
MKTPDLSQTPVVRRFGVQGARLFARVWFSVVYVLLIALTATLWILSPEFNNSSHRTLIGCFAAVLVITAASRLARMRVEFLAGVEQLERNEPARRPK